ncbi:MAG: VWA domain-containing protein [Planctomycetota bacterium]
MSNWISFEFGNLWALLLGAAVIAATVAIGRRSIAGQSRSRYRFSLVVRILILLLLTAALADMKLRLPGHGVTVLFLLDVSDSVPRPARDASLAFLEEETADLGVDDRAGLIVFGGDASVERSVSQEQLRVGRMQSVIDPDGTDIGAALRLADATFIGAGTEGGRRVVIVSDGNATGGDELIEARNLAVSGAVIDVLPIDYEHAEEVLVDGVQVPAQVHVEEPYRVDGIIESDIATAAEVQLYENGTLVEARTVQLNPGKNRVSFERVNVERARYRYALRVFPERDAVTKNNVGYGFTLIQDRARVLFIGDPVKQAPLLEAFDSGEILYDVVSPVAVPLQAEEYFAYESIVLADVSHFELGIDRMQLLHGVVKNLGVGFVMVGGPNSFGAGGYRGTPIEKLLPVEMEVRQRRMIPNGALALVLHTCEFALGNMWAKRIAQVAVDALSPEDYVGVLLWDGVGSDRWGVPFTLAEDKPRIKALIRTLQPMDMQSFAPSMELALDTLKPAKASQKHVIIISDGDPAPPTQPVMQGLIDSGISVTCVCIQPHGNRDTGQMKKIAKDTGGRYYLVSDPEQLPQIFFREALEVRRNLITEETFTPKIALPSEVLQGVADAGLPPLHGYVITTPKPLAETSLVSHYDDPVFSEWRYGLARTAAFTSDATGRWASDWIGWPGFDTFWAQVVRSIARRGRGELFRVERTIEGERGTVTLDAIDPDGRYVDGLAVQGRVLDPEAGEEVISFQQTGPGRYEAHFNASRAGSYLLSLAYDGEDGVEGMTQTGLNVPYSPEYRQRNANLERLAALAESTGGRVLKAGDDLYSHDVPQQYRKRALLAELLIAALLLFFIDIFARRVYVTLEPLKRALAVLRGRGSARPKPAAEEATLGQLLNQRDRSRSQAPATTQFELGDVDAQRKTDAALASKPDGASGEETSAEEPLAKDGESFTDRLLRAKRKAREDQDRP